MSVLDFGLWVSSGCGVVVELWVTAMVASDQLWVDKWFFFFCVFGGGSSGGAVAVVWWVWCKKVYSMVVFGMGLLGCF